MAHLIYGYLTQAKKCGQEPDEELLAPLQTALKAHQGRQQDDSEET